MVKRPRVKKDQGDDGPRVYYSESGIYTRHFVTQLWKTNGFTLLELMIVLAIMGVLVSIAQPSLKISIVRAREAVLREDLFEMREAIDQYYADNDKYPPTLQDLINQQEKTNSYLEKIPKTPLPERATGSRLHLRARIVACSTHMCQSPDCFRRNYLQFLVIFTSIRFVC